MPARLTSKSSKSSSPRAKPVEIAHRLRRSQWLRRPPLQAGLRPLLRHENKMRTSSQWKVHGSEPVVDFLDAAAPGKFETSHSASRRELLSMSYREQAIFLGELIMVEPG